jgi:hypothetical protein
LKSQICTRNACRKQRRLSIVSAIVNEDIICPPQGISNISEWCKREGCWARLIEHIDRISQSLPSQFWLSLTSAEDDLHETKTARQNQKIEDGIGLQTRIFEIPKAQWSKIVKEGQTRNILTPKELSILQIALQIPAKLPTEKQSAVLIEVLDKAREEGIV